jgi:hypothetical protein
VTVQITLTEEIGTGTMPTHGLFDVAAALASDAWNDTQAGQAVGELHLAVQDHIPHETANAIGHIMYSREAAVRYGARLGYALARTNTVAEKGWDVWLAAAKEWLAQTNCSAAEHHDSLIEHCTAETKKLSSLTSAPAVWLLIALYRPRQSLQPDWYRWPSSTPTW